MKHKTMYAILDVMLLFFQSEGQSAQNLATVATWSGVPRMTTYRYLLKMERMGLVERRDIPFRGTMVTGWRITGRGYVFVTGGSQY